MTNKTKRCNVRLNTSGFFVRSNIDQKIGEKIYAHKPLTSSGIKSSITRDEKCDYLKDGEYTYEVETRVVRKYRSYDLCEITEPIEKDESILKDSEENFSEI